MDNGIVVAKANMVKLSESVKNKTIGGKQNGNKPSTGRTTKHTNKKAKRQTKKSK